MLSRSRGLMRILKESSSPPQPAPWSWTSLCEHPWRDQRTSFLPLSGRPSSPDSYHDPNNVEIEIKLSARCPTSLSSLLPPELCKSPLRAICRPLADLFVLPR